jgi:hypothetical protein
LPWLAASFPDTAFSSFTFGFSDALASALTEIHKAAQALK